MKKLVIIATVALLFASCGTSNADSGKCIENVDSTAACIADSTACHAADSAKALGENKAAEDSLK